MDANAERPYTVVVGVSPTSKSEFALRWAAAQVAEQQGKLIAVRAWYSSVPPSAPSVQGGLPTRSVEQAQDAEDQLRLDVESVLGADHGAEVRLVTGEGRAHALVAASVDADLLVLDAPRQLVVGPMLAHRIIYNAKCPVVVMPPRVTGEPPSALARGGKALAEGLLRSAGTAGKPGWRPPRTDTE